MPAGDSITAGDAKSSWRTLLGVLLVLLAILVVAALVMSAYLFTRPTPYSGDWVGFGDFQGSGDAYAIEIYLSLDQTPLSISGTATICAFTSRSDGINSTSSTRILPMTVQGNVSSNSVNLALYPDEGPNAAGNPIVFTQILQVQGTLSQKQLTLKSTTQQRLLLTLQHGSQNDFTIACDHLRQ